MAITWDQLPLTPPQQQLMKDLANWYIGGMVGNPPTTYSQSKQANAWHGDLRTLVQPAELAAREAAMFYQRKAVQDYDTANP